MSCAVLNVVEDVDLSILTCNKIYVKFHVIVGSIGNLIILKVDTVCVDIIHYTVGRDIGISCVSNVNVASVFGSANGICDILVGISRYTVSLTLSSACGVIEIVVVKYRAIG